VMSSVELHLSDEVTYNVMKEKTAKSTWGKLEKLYMEKTLSNKLFLKDQLLNLRMEEEGDVMEHLNEFNHCVNDLLRVEVKYEEDKALLLLQSLPCLSSIFGPHSCLARRISCSRRLSKTSFLMSR